MKLKTKENSDQTVEVHAPYSGTVALDVKRTSEFIPNPSEFLVDLTPDEARKVAKALKKKAKQADAR